MKQKTTPYTKKYLQKRSQEVDSIQNEINRIFDKHLMPAKQSYLQDNDILNPDIDIFETDKEIQIEAELAGLDANDIDIQISKDGILTISGEKTNSHEETGENGYYFSERSFGFLNRCIALPENCQTEKAEADLKNGVLKITIPKKTDEKEAPKKVKIKE
ncbi:MAG: Hsp20/alpha crystallin family protein [Alphaproteobacteria bacterium]|nr:Hsp20/alpha crystallin family protein [Alphaproteobacteria bacterium]